MVTVGQGVLRINIVVVSLSTVQVKTHSFQKEKELLEDSIQNYKRERKVVQGNITMMPEQDQFIRSTEDIRLLKCSLLRLVQVTVF